MGKKRIIITGGGTAGHIYPAVSVIEYIKDKYPDTGILFIGTGKGMEKDLIAELGIEFRTISAAGLAATDNFLKKIYIYLRFFFLLIAGSARSVSIIRGFKPDLVLGTGGYVCGPVFAGARLLGKKIAIHEQNYIPGRLNRVFAKYSELVFVSFKGTQPMFDIKDGDRIPRFVFSGNPVRREIRDFASLPPDYEGYGLERGRFTIIAFGGSLGAERINNTVFGLYEYYRKRRDLQFVLICGRRFYPELVEKLRDCVKPPDKLLFRLFPYIKGMAGIYRIADLVISRAGATTVAELAATCIPAILVPYPGAVENHQFYNASYLAETGKSMIIPDRDLDEEVLISNIESLLANNGEKYVNMKKEASNHIQPESEAIIVEKMFGLI